MIVVDGVFFQLWRTGISRAWASILGEWSKMPIAKELLVLDRTSPEGKSTAPRFPNIHYENIPAYVFGTTGIQSQLLEAVCKQVQAKIFVSTYYTRPLSFPTIQLVYDMIPEVFDLNIKVDPQWVEKTDAFNHATYFVCISENTRKDLVRFFPRAENSTTKVIHCGVDRNLFYRSSAAEIVGFYEKHGITRPYFLLVGPSKGYKNAEMFFKALGMLPSQHGFEVVLVGGNVGPEEFAEFCPGTVRHQLSLEDEDLRAAYSGALALAYPSLYEGFGLPILEAFACGCPVVTTPHSSVPEVAGCAAIYVRTDRELAEALCEVQKPSVVHALLQESRRQLSGFSWTKMARELAEYITDKAGQS